MQILCGTVRQVFLNWNINCTCIVDMIVVYNIMHNIQTEDADRLQIHSSVFQCFGKSQRFVPRLPSKFTHSCV